MAYSICDNLAVHGPFNQYNFMGCSVESFTMSVGLNEQQTEVSVELVQDCASVPEGGNPKIYYDDLLVQRENYGPDPGFINPGVGSPVYFRIGNCEFSGLLQAWTKKDSADGRPKYSVRLVDPRQILEGTQLILDSYSGGVGTCYNLINVFGFMERFGSNATCVPTAFESGCADTYGSALGFGGSGRTEEGMSSNRILLGTHLLTSGMNANANIFSPYGRLVFKGAKIAGHGIMLPDAQDNNLYFNFGGVVSQDSAYHDGYIAYYSLDLTELPVIDDAFRISGDSISVLDLIGQICDISSHDYYIELIPTYNGIGLNKIIKVRTINRNTQPGLQSLDTYINSNQTVDTSIGNELRNETTTVFLSGANKESIYTVEGDVDPYDALNKPQKMTDRGFHKIYNLLIPHGLWLGDTIYQEDGIPLECDDFGNDSNNTTIPTVASGCRAAGVSGPPAYGGLFHEGDGQEYDFRDLMICPYMGLDRNGNVLIPKIIYHELDGSGCYSHKIFAWYPIDISGLIFTMDDSIDVGFMRIGATEIATEIIIDEMEIISALLSYESWLSWAMTRNTELYQTADPNKTLNLQATLQALGNRANGVAPMMAHAIPPPVVAPAVAAAAANTQKRIRRNLDRAYEFITKFAESYGTKFMVRVPEACIKRDVNSGEFTYSQVPSNEGWTDTSPIMGLTNPSNTMNIFNTEQGKIKCFVKYWQESALDINAAKPMANFYLLDELAQDSFLSTDDEIDKWIYLPAEVEEGYVYGKLSTLCSPRVVITINSPLKLENGVTDNIDVRNSALAGIVVSNIGAGGFSLTQAQIAEYQKKSMLVFNIGLSNRLAIPHGVAIPFKSNINRYGPWITAGPPGQIRFEINEDLAPWNYGSTANMCAIGQLLSDEGISIQQAIEVGSITLPGFPRWNPGAEFSSIVGGKNLIENRNIQSNGFSEVAVGDSDPTDLDYLYIPSENGGAWSGLYGPIITDISVSVGPQGIQTTYSFRTYTSKSGKFSRLNAARMQKIGKVENKVEKIKNFIENRVELKEQKDKIKKLDKINKKRRAGPQPGGFF